LEQKLYYRIAKIFFLILPLLVVAIMFLRAGGNIINYIVYIAIALVLYYLILKIIWRIFLYIAFGGLENDTRKTNANAIQQSVSPIPQSTPAKAIGPIIVIIFCIAIFAIAFSQTNTNPFQAHTYGASCTSDGKTGLYGTNGTCYTCSSGSTAVTNPVNNCSDGIAGVYCCNNANNDGDKNSKCIPTGCGSSWYCSGTYYLGGQQLRVNGCLPMQARDIYPSWSGTCRQCP
ncbi:MAG: hypothetical protein Q8N98_00340, partial [bacterium]|nr:hypothetical protein [bacterium]